MTVHRTSPRAAVRRLATARLISITGGAAAYTALMFTVYERTRELGMLRAVGMTKRQTRRMIRHESVITALIGAALGVPLGIFLAILVTQALSQFDLQFAVPTGWLIAVAARRFDVHHPATPSRLNAVSCSTASPARSTSPRSSPGSYRRWCP